MPSGSSGTDGAWTAQKNAPPPPVPNRNTSTVACSDGERDGDVTGVLRDLALADRTLLLEFFELRDDDAEHLHDDAGRDVGHDAEREDRERLERPAREQVEQPERTVLGALTELIDGERIDTRHSDGRTDAVERRRS